jgi:V8-like Glu-specific endopeptidase
MSSPYTSVSNLPEEVAEPVLTRKVTQPATQGVDARTAPANERGLEAVADNAPAGAAAGGPEAVAVAAPERFVPPESAELRDIGEASFGPPPAVAEAVIGPDDRVQITDTTSYPWRAIASLLITARDSSTWVGTGWLVSPRTLITAGHCVYIKHSPAPGRDGWVKRIDVMFGRNGSTLPYGSVTSTIFKSVTGWTENGDENFDFAAIILPIPLADTVGVFGIGVYPDAELQSLPVNISGYPADKASGTQWYDANSISSMNARKLYYFNDTAGGQSGAAVFRIEGDSRIGAAVHAYGGTTANSGTRINDEVYNRMTSWME